MSPDDRLQAAFTTVGPSRKSQAITLGTLGGFVSLFPSKFDGTFLGKLGGLLSVRGSRQGVRTEPSLIVDLGVGLVYAEKLHNFFNGVLEFQNKENFSAFLSTGFSFMITGGSHAEIVAAATFTTTSDGLFIDALAVANGHAPQACKLLENQFVSSEDLLSLVNRSNSEGSFQKLGLGNFLLSLMAHVATFACTDEEVSVFLKANALGCEFYIKSGFTQCLPNTRLPEKLSQLVPFEHYDTSATKTLLLSKRLRKQTVIPPTSPTIAATAGEEETTPLHRSPSTSVASPVRCPIPANDANSSHDDSDAGSSSEENGTTPAVLTTRTSPRKVGGKEELVHRKRTALDGERTDAKTKRRRVEEKRFKAMATCVIEDSDDSSCEYDYGNYATNLTLDGKWIFPIKDFWEPQSKNSKELRASPLDKIEATHHLTQAEIFAKYPSTGTALPFGRVKILSQARSYQTDTDYCRRQGLQRCNVQFRLQDYVDFACVADQNRGIAVDYTSYRRAEQLIAVRVCSYKIPRTATITLLLENQRDRNKLVPEVRTLDVDLKWLRSSCHPEITKVIDDFVLGSKVMRIRGANIGTDDACSLSFSGSEERVEGFLSLPQGHKAVIHNVEQPKATDATQPDKREIWYDLQHRVTDQMRKFQKHLHLELDLRYAPPPPEDTTQIVKLKWIPSQKRQPIDGIWHGLFAVKVGVSQSNTTLQECSLTQEWVESAFSVAFLNECRSIANSGTTRRNAKKYLYIPAGDSRNVDDDPPPNDELLAGVGVHFQQGDLDSCLRHSMASALHTMGFAEEAKALALESSISGSTVLLVERAAQCVRKLFKRSNLVLKKVFATASSVAQVAQEDSSWPMVLIIQTSDGVYGSHAITTWKGMIFDSTSPHALQWSQRSLDWCSGLGSTCIGFSKVYRLCPENFGRVLPDSTIRVGTQVQSCVGVSNALGWVRRSQIKDKKRPYVVCYVDGKRAAWSLSEVMKYTLNKG
jgi:hypothetical protein